MTVIDRFNRLYFGDRILRFIHIDHRLGQISLGFDSVIVLKDVPQPSIFDPHSDIEKAVVTFLDCDRLVVPGTTYAFNSLVVEFSATELSDKIISFRFALTGGRDNDTFWVELEILAKDFTITPPIAS